MLSVVQPGGPQGHVATKYTSAAFDRQGGRLYTGCYAIKMWNAEVDGKVKIKALQVETLSKALLKERRVVQQEVPPNATEPVFKTELSRGGVLVSITSELVDVVLTDSGTALDKYSFLITVDSENLLRAWSVRKGLTTFSYKIGMKKRITAAAATEEGDKQYLAIGNCIGEV